MTDHLDVQSGAYSGKLATDNIADVHYPRQKVVFGPDGTATDVSATNPLPIAEQDKTPLELALARALVAGTALERMEGVNGSLGTSYEPVRPGSELPWPDSTGTLTLVSSLDTDKPSGSGAHIVRVTGLDTNWAEQTETITLNGTTPVVSSLTYARVNKIEVVQAGNTGAPDGAITVSDPGATVRLTLEAGQNRSRSVHYSVPAGKTAYLRLAGIQLGGPDPCEFQILNRNPASNPTVYALLATGYGELAIPMVAVAEKTDLYMRAKRLGSTGDQPVLGFVELLLLDD